MAVEPEDECDAGKAADLEQSDAVVNQMDLWRSGEQFRGSAGDADS